MHCPICGSKLIEVKRNKLDFSNYDEWPEDLKKAADRIDNDASVWFKCDNCKSFGDDYPIVCHGVYGGITSEPGDSWSLSWVK